MPDADIEQIERIATMRVALGEAGKALSHIEALSHAEPSKDTLAKIGGWASRGLIAFEGLEEDEEAPE